MIEVLFSPAPADEVPAIEVTSYPSPLDPALNLTRVCAYVREGNALAVRDVVSACRISLETGTAAALRYAERMCLTKVYVLSAIPPSRYAEVAVST